MINSIRKNFLIKGSICFLFALLFVFTLPVFAGSVETDDKNSLRWSHYYSADCLLTINNGIAEIKGEATINPSNTRMVNVYLELQIKAPNGSWTYVSSYSDTGNSTVKILKTRALRQRGEYRIVMTAVAYGEGTETRTCSDYASYH